MAKRIFAILIVCITVLLICSCESDMWKVRSSKVTEESATYTTDSTTVTTTASTTASTTALTATETTVTHTTTEKNKITVTAPGVNMPTDETSWANYIVDSGYNYIADRLTKNQKTTAANMAAMVGYKVVIGKDKTTVTDSKKNSVVYSKKFNSDLGISEPDFGVLTLTKSTKSETVMIYRCVSIFGFIKYSEIVKQDGFSGSVHSSVDCIASEAIFTGRNEDGDCAIIKLTGDMLVISVESEKNK